MGTDAMIEVKLTGTEELIAALLDTAMLMNAMTDRVDRLEELLTQTRYELDAHVGMINELMGKVKMLKGAARRGTYSQTGQLSGWRIAE